MAKAGSVRSPCPTNRSSTSSSTPPPIDPSSTDRALADVFCNRCGHRNPGNSNFCSSCGAPLPARPEDHTITLGPADEVGDPTEEVSVALEEIPPGSGLLLVKRGPGPGSRFVTNSALTS